MGDHRRRRLLVYEYKLRLSCAQAAAIEETIRTTAVHLQQVRAPVDGWTRALP